jgi:hypothetical protein
MMGSQPVRWAIWQINADVVSIPVWRIRPVTILAISTS